MDRRIVWWELYGKKLNLQIVIKGWEHLLNQEFDLCKTNVPANWTDSGLNGVFFLFNLTICSDLVSCPV